MKKKWMYCVMALGLVMGTYACSGDEYSTDESGDATEVTAEQKQKLEDAKELESEAIMLDAEVDGFVESL